MVLYNLRSYINDNEASSPCAKYPWALSTVFIRTQPKAICVLQTKVHVLIFGVFSRKKVQCARLWAWTSFKEKKCGLNTTPEDYHSFLHSCQETNIPKHSFLPDLIISHFSQLVRKSRPNRNTVSLFCAGTMESDEVFICTCFIDSLWEF